MAEPKLPKPIPRPAPAPAIAPTSAMWRNTNEPLNGTAPAAPKAS